MGPLIAALLIAAPSSAPKGQPADWPKALPFPKFEEVQTEGWPHSSGKFPDGIIELRLIARGNFKTTWVAWIDALENADVQIQAARISLQESSATLTTKKGARYFVSMRSGSRLWLVLRGATKRAPKLPGPCVAIPDDDWRIDFETSWDNQRRLHSTAFSTRWLVDVDRDGFADALVPKIDRRNASWACARDVQWDLYISRGKCGHFAGRLQGWPDRRRPSPVELSGGLAVLRYYREPTSPMEEPITYRYEFDGKKYQETNKEVGKSRCWIHPADCGSSHRVCKVRGHPSILAPFGEAAAYAQIDARTKASKQCTTKKKIRCDVSMDFMPKTGRARLKIKDCGAATRCVRKAFSDLRVPPFALRSGRSKWMSVSFQLPPP